MCCYNLGEMQIVVPTPPMSFSVQPWLSPGTRSADQAGLRLGDLSLSAPGMLGESHHRLALKRFTSICGVCLGCA